MMQIEKLPDLLELVSRAKDNGRKEDVEKDGRLEADHALHDSPRRYSDDEADKHAWTERQVGSTAGQKHRMSTHQQRER
jgi:hypothetical protein